MFSATRALQRGWAGVVTSTMLFGLWLPIFSAAQTPAATPLSFTPQSNGNFDGFIAIRVPPGRGDLTPQMWLSYSSHSLNGTVGLGFSLQGFPAIVRCSKTLTQDGIRGRVNYDENDRFCFNGERLVVTNGGGYGENGTVYGTELNTFVKVTSYGRSGNGPTYFVVQNKNGLTQTFGNTPSSAVPVAGTNTLRVWPVSKVTNRAGDAYEVTYKNDAINATYSPSTVTYTGKDRASPRETVRFTFTPRSDVIRNWTNGSPVTIVERLTAISVVQDDQPIRQYQLNYDNGASGGVSRLQSVQECTKEATCFPTVTFTWSGGQASNQTGSFRYTSWQLPDSISCRPGDKNVSFGAYSGNGRSDLLCSSSALPRLRPIKVVSNGNGQFTPMMEPGPGAIGCASGKNFVGDFNGNGLTDVGCLAGKNVEVSTSRVKGNFAAPTSWTPPANSLCSDRTATVLTGDFDGDGRSDLLCVVDNGSNATVHAAFSQGDGTFVEASTPAFTWCTAQYLKTFDVGGHGKSDLLCLNTATGEISSALSNGDGSFTPGSTPFVCPGTFGPGAKMMPGDFNGDGKIDVLCSDVGGHQSVAFSMGNGNFTAAATNAFSSGAAWCAANDGVLNVGDFNGDGKSDLICHGADHHIAIAFSNGDGSFTEPTRAEREWCSVGTLLIGDVSGDGEADLVCINGATVSSALSVGDPDLIVKVDNGAGLTAVPGYLPITNSDVYTRDSGSDAAVYPMRDVVGPYYVVASIVRLNNGALANSHHYNYGGLKVDSDGRGSLGYRTVSSTDEQTFVTTSSVYRQTFPYIGQSISTQTTLPGRGNKGLAKETLRAYYCNNRPTCPVIRGAQYFVSIYETVESNWDSEGKPLATTAKITTYDDFGNPLKIVNILGDGRTTTTTNRYQAPNLADWTVGQLIDSQTSSTTPAVSN